MGRQQAMTTTNLIGKQFRCVINGTLSLNGGEPYSAEIFGTIEEIEGDANIYEVMRQVADYAEENNLRMENPTGAALMIGDIFENDDDNSKAIL
jgi:hypothetical protein